MKPDNAELSRLELLRRRACCTLQEACLERWPLESMVAVMLSHCQRVPSLGMVIACSGEGELAVRLTKPDRRGRNRVKRVNWRRVQP